MRDITIKNFRCYEETSMEFRSGVNLLIAHSNAPFVLAVVAGVIDNLTATGIYSL